MKWIKKILGISELLKSIQETKTLLEKIEKNTKRIADLTQKYNDAYHIK